MLITENAVQARKETIEMCGCQSLKMVCRVQRAGKGRLPRTLCRTRKVRIGGCVHDVCIGFVAERGGQGERGG